MKGVGPSCILSMKTDSAVALKQLNTQSVTVRSRTAAQKLTYLRELVYQAPQVEPIYISGQSQRADGQTKILSGQPLKEAQRHFNLVPRTDLRIQVCYHPVFSPKLVSIQEDRETTHVSGEIRDDIGCVREDRGVGTRQLGTEYQQMTQQERKQYEWYMRMYHKADRTKDPARERERISMIIAALFSHCSHMPPERTEKKQGRKKGRCRLISGNAYASNLGVFFGKRLVNLREKPGSTADCCAGCEDPDSPGGTLGCSSGAFCSSCLSSSNLPGEDEDELELGLDDDDDDDDDDGDGDLFLEDPVVWAFCLVLI